MTRILLLVSLWGIDGIKSLQSDPVWTAGVVAALAAPAADQWTTHEAIKRGAHEAGLLGAWGGTGKGYAVQMAVTGGIVYLTSQLHRTHPKAARIIIWLLAGSTITVAVHNTSCE